MLSVTAMMVEDDEDVPVKLVVAEDEESEDEESEVVESFLVRSK